MGIRLLALLVLLAWAYSFFIQTEPSAVDPIVSASVPGPGGSDYTVSNMENGAACLISRRQAVGSRSHQVSPGSDCETVWPGLAAARNWTENDDGTVVLTDGSGAALLTLGLGDGVDFESVEPANAVLALNEVR